MSFENTFFPYFGKFCNEKFGSSLGALIAHEAESRLYGLLEEADYRGNKYIKWHMETNMLPAIAIWQAFKQFEQTADKAYEYTDEVLQIARLKNQKKNQPIGKSPFGYFLYKLFCKSIMQREYPPQGWSIEWVRYDREEIHFNMKSCIYHEITKKYDCAEMCPLFCANDDVVLLGYQPAVVFERGGTIALGQDVCDFHFLNGKYAQKRASNER